MPTPTAYGPVGVMSTAVRDRPTAYPMIPISTTTTANAEIRRTRGMLVDRGQGAVPDHPFCGAARPPAGAEQTEEEDRGAQAGDDPPGGMARVDQVGAAGHHRPDDRHAQRAAHLAAGRRDRRGHAGLLAG